MAQAGIQRREFWSVILLAALAMAALLEASRVFVSYLVFVVDQSRRVEIAAIVAAVFLLPALTPLLTRRFGLRTSAVAAALSLSAFRIILQFVDAPLLRLAAGGAVVVCWGALMIVLLSNRRALAGYGALLGMGADVSLRVVLRTVDLPWMAHFWKDAMSLLIAGLIVLLALYLPRRLSAGEADWRGSLPILAIGSGIALYHLALGNPGIAEVRAGVSYLDAARALAFGLFAGIAIPWLWIMRSEPTRSRVSLVLLPLTFIVSGAGLTVWIGFAWHAPRLLAVAVVGLAVAATVLLIGVALGRSPALALPSVTRTTVWLTAGMVLQFVVLFVYYSASGLLWMIALAWIVVAACAAFAIISAPALRASVLSRRLFLGIVLVGIVAHIAAVQMTIASTRPLGVGQPAGTTLTVMTYNIQSGFSLDNHWSLEAQARVIEAYDPDIVVLQEVSRGWLVTTATDDLLWLSRRLEMSYAWGPASEDGLWGNAILSKAPLSNVKTRRYSSTANFKRSAVMAQVDTVAGPIWVIGTHLDNPSGAEVVRAAQNAELLEFWNNAAPAIIMGDFNTEPDDPVIETVIAQGFADVGGSVSPVEPTSEDGRRIDYIFATREFTVDNVVVPETTASDHRPLVATLTLNP